MTTEFVPEMRSDKKDAEIARLREALKKYGEHEVDCELLGTHKPCSCGFDAALGEEK